MADLFGFVDFARLTARDERAWLDAGGQLLGWAKAAAQSEQPKLSKDKIDHVAGKALEEMIHKIEEFATEGDLLKCLSTCAKRRAIDESRRESNKTDVLSNRNSDDYAELNLQRDKARTPDEIAISTEVAIAVAEQLKNLPTEDANLLSERYIQDLSYNDIGSIHGWKTESVGGYISKALQRARKHVATNPQLKEYG